MITAKEKKISRSEYGKIHRWLKKEYGPANLCSNSKCAGKYKNYNWALKKNCYYKKLRRNFIQLCVSCHRKYDAKYNNVGKVVSGRYAKPVNPRRKEIATCQIRISESTLKVLQKVSEDTGKSIARIISEKVKI